jgi:hypothetical protein
MGKAQKPLRPKGSKSPIKPSKIVFNSLVKVAETSQLLLLRLGVAFPYSRHHISKPVAFWRLSAKCTALVRCYRRAIIYGIATPISNGLIEKYRKLAM